MSYETEYTSEIICPHCGRKISYSIDYDLSEDPTRIVCNNCDREIWASREIIYRYTTHKVTWKLDGEKKIDRCANCSCFEKKLKDYNGFKDYAKRCLKSDRMILVDADDNIEHFCELESAEEE